jgi:flagellar basal body-associated protein FliL
MEGGIAILLIVIIVVIAGGIGIALYLTGGALTLGRKTPRRDEHRPEHTEATSPELEHTEMVGADKAVEDRS